MNFERLEKNLCDNILEAQIKLGYDGKPLSLNYTLPSLCHLSETDCTEEEMHKLLTEFTAYAQPKLGKITFRPIKNGFCLTVPETGTAYVHGKSSGKEFIASLIDAVRSHAPLDKVIEVFRSYSDDVRIKEINNEEFSHIVYFKNGSPDEYIYCLTSEEEIDGSTHITYHRFIKEDYNDFGF